MPQQRHSPTGTNDPWQPSLKKQGHSEAEQERIDLALAKLVRRLDRGAMTADQINQWHEDLGAFPVEAIEYALDFFGKNAVNSKFPKPRVVYDLCASWWNNKAAPTIPAGCGKCNWLGMVMGSHPEYKEPVARVCECVKDERLRTINPVYNPAMKGKGYGENDLKWLLRRYSKERLKLNRAPTEEEIDGLFIELDTKRGKPPAWRATD